MKPYAALFVFLPLMAAPTQAQYLSVDEIMEERMNGMPILDPKLELLINEVYLANFNAVDFHNKKLVTELRERVPDGAWGMLVNGEMWVLQQRVMVAKWTGWDLAYPEWFRKKRVEASASVAASGGAKKVKDVETMKAQNHTMLLWRSVLLTIDQLDKNKGVIEGMGDLDDLWSEWLYRIDKLDKAINELRKY